LLALRFVLVRLPMIAHAGPALIASGFTPLVVPVTMARIVQTVLDALIFVIVLVTARGMQPQLRQAVPRLPAIATMVFLASILIVLALAYSSFTPVVSALIGDQDVYDGLFLALGLIAVGALALVVYRNLDAITDLAFHSGTRALRGASTVGVAGAAAPAGVRHCVSCRTELPPDARFCGRCGRAVDATPGEAGR
jgi:hypothetical protein